MTWSVLVVRSPCLRRLLDAFFGLGRGNLFWREEAVNHSSNSSRGAKPSEKLSRLTPLDTKLTLWHQITDFGVLRLI
jgi:hypothetical protein